MFQGINWLAVIAATISSLIIAAIWYTKLFKKAWFEETGFIEAELEANPKGIGNSDIKTGLGTRSRTVLCNALPLLHEDGLLVLKQTFQNFSPF
jgi:N-acetylglutamate synthase-like GNAT family acetyltransferase